MGSCARGGRVGHPLCIVFTLAARGISIPLRSVRHCDRECTLHLLGFHHVAPPLVVVPAIEPSEIDPDGTGG